MSHPGVMLFGMQAASEPESGRRIYACLYDDFHERFVGSNKRGDPLPFACIECGAEAYARGGDPGRKHKDGSARKPLTGHFVHSQKAECPYGQARRSESEAHRMMKRFVAETILGCPGWDVAVEVAGAGWRADVRALERHDIAAVIGRDDDREVVFEVQHTAEAHARTLQRTQLYRNAGCEVVWLFDHPSASQVGWDAAVLVNHRGHRDYAVTKGVWAPGGAAPEVGLGRFVQAVLEGDVTYKDLPRGPARSVRAVRVAPRGWVFTRDLPALEGRRRSVERSAELSHARALAAEHLDTRLAGHGIAALARRPDDRAYAYATVLTTQIGTIAVHPRVRQATPEILESLGGCVAVIVASERDKMAFADAGLDHRVVFTLNDFEPAIRHFVAPKPPPAPIQSASQRALTTAGTTRPQVAQDRSSPATVRTDGVPLPSRFRRWTRRLRRG